MPVNRLFLQGILVALILSLSGWILYWTLLFYFSFTATMNLLIPAMGFCYMLFLSIYKYDTDAAGLRKVYQSGFFTFYALYLVITISMLLWRNSLAMHILFQLFSIWLFRSVFYQKKFMSMLLDGCLILLSLALTFFIVLRTHNIFLSLWGFFLLQSLWIFIPSSCHSIHQFFSKLPEQYRTTSSYYSESLCSTFDQQERTARNAIVKLTLSEQAIHLTSEQTRRTS